MIKVGRVTEVFRLKEFNVYTIHVDDMRSLNVKNEDMIYFSESGCGRIDGINFNVGKSIMNIILKDKFKDVSVGEVVSLINATESA